MKWSSKEISVAVVVLVLFLVLAGGPDIVATVTDTITNGSRVGDSTELGDDGLIDADPNELASDAGLDLETYSLARCAASEHTNDPDVYLQAVCWAVKNMAAERGESVFELVTNGAGGGGNGYFGEQKAAAGTKYASTAQDPHERHVTFAKGVIEGSLPDITGGCTHFFSPQAQDALAAKAAAGDAAFAKYAGKDSAYIMRTWAAPGGLYAGGAVAVVPPGIDGRRLTLWRKA